MNLKNETTFLTGVQNCQEDPPRGYSPMTNPSPLADVQFYGVMACWQRAVEPGTDEILF